MSISVEEVKHVSAFAQSQMSLRDGGQKPRVIASQAAMLQGRIARTCPLDAVLAKDLTEAISQGPWTSEQKVSIADAISNRMIELASVDQEKGKRRSNQVVTGFQNYMTKGEVDILTGEHNDIHKLSVLVDRCCKVGVDIPSEKSVKHIISVYLSISKPGTHDPLAARAASLELKRLLKSRCRVTPCVVSGITDYPEDPRQLPSVLYEKAYAAEAPLMNAVDLTTLSDSGSVVACRKTSRLVRGSVAITPIDPPVMMAANAAQIMSQNPMTMMGQQFMNMMMNMCNQQMNHRGSTVPIQFNNQYPLNHTPPPPPTPATPLAIADTPSPEQTPKHDSPNQQKVGSLCEWPQPTMPLSQSLTVVDTAFGARTVATEDDNDATTHKKKGVKKTNQKSSSSKQAPKAKAKAKGNKPSHSAKTSKANLKAPSDLLKKHSGGCARCRYTKGCTPSCWKLRGY